MKQKANFIRKILPKPKIDKSIRAGQVGGINKNTYHEKGFRSVIDITAIVKEELGLENRTPPKHSVGDGLGPLVALEGN